MIVRLLCFILGLMCSENLYNIFQLKDYHFLRYLSCLKAKILSTILAFLFIIITFLNPNTIFILECLSTVVLPLMFYKQKFEKTPLKITRRISLDYIIFIHLSICIISISPILYVGVYLYLIPISNSLNFISNFTNKQSIKSASNKLKNSKAKVIAITGSNGKTTIKNILQKILSTKYNVIASPKSYNTPLGNAKFINDSLTSETDYIILEYGARHRGDIKKLCKLFGADYGIVSCVSPQHLEYFGSIENIFLAKKELPDYLKNKLCIYNCSNLYTLRMFQKKSGEKIGVEKPNIRIKNFKTNFTLFDKPISTNLLGEENAIDIILAATLALKLNVDRDSITTIVESINPVEHRLQYIKSRINILDDSYNCSLMSAKQSISVLKSTSYKKMIVTPGIIEGGKSERLINFRLGQMLDGIEYIILVGQKNKDAMISGILSNNTASKVICVANLEKAKDYFKLLNDKDTLLILNDLPDDYN